MASVPTTTAFKRALLAAEPVPGHSGRIFKWIVNVDSELIDVRLVDVVGDVDIKWVYVGIDLQMAFRRRRSRARVGVYVVVEVENYGLETGRCGVELDYRELV